MLTMHLATQLDPQFLSNVIFKNIFKPTSLLMDHFMHPK